MQGSQRTSDLDNVTTVFMRKKNGQLSVSARELRFVYAANATVKIHCHMCLLKRSVACAATVRFRRLGGVPNEAFVHEALLTRPLGDAAEDVSLFGPGNEPSVD